MLLSPLATFCLRLLRDGRDREILSLRQQVLILQRRLAKRPRLSRSERLALLVTFWAMTQRELLASLMIVKPATLVAWHSQIVRRHWAFRGRRRPGRPRITPEAEHLILHIARENPQWGYTNIAREVRKLGFVGLGRSTVTRILRRHGFFPSAQHGSLSWHDFLAHYGQSIWARDFFTVTTATLRTYYVLFFIEIRTRRIVFWNTSQHPDGVWVVQQFRDLSIPHDELPRHLLHDRDSKFTAHGDELLRASGMQPIQLPVRSPNLNACAERWIRTVREECLDRIIVLNEHHLRWVLNEFVRYYNQRRPRRSPKLHEPDGPCVCSREGKVACRQVFRGPINDYRRKAA